MHIGPFSFCKQWRCHRLIPTLWDSQPHFTDEKIEAGREVEGDMAQVTHLCIRVCSCCLATNSQVLAFNLWPSNTEARGSTNCCLAPAVSSWEMEVAWLWSGFVCEVCDVGVLFVMYKTTAEKPHLFETPPVSLAYIPVRAKTWSVLLYEAATHHRPC